MKKMIFLMSFGLLIFSGCGKEENSISAENQQEVEPSVTFLISNGETEYWETFSTEDLIGTLGNSQVRSNSAHTHGEFTTSGSSEFYTIYDFNGTQNNGGPHGSAELITVAPNGYRHVILETTCVVVEGNEATYGGVVIEVIENTIPNPPPPPPPPPCPSFPNCPPPPPPPSCAPFDLGFHAYFRVVDNGQGNNASPDQYVTIIGACNPIPNCAGFFPWFIFPKHDVANESDHIKVNN